MCYCLPLRQRFSEASPQPILLSSIPSHDGLQSPGPNIEHSHHNTSYGNYNNQGQQVSGPGNITNISQTINHQYSSSNLLEQLEKHCSSTAAFDSAARFDPPRCAEFTRLRIIRIIEEWINGHGDEATPSSLFWLHGGAGAGKSALAQSLSEIFKEKKQLAASFFFFRGDSSRSNGDHLIPTLVSHLVDTFKGIGPFVEDSIRENRALFTKRYQTQMRQLLIDPLLALKSQEDLNNRPRLIVIDGLDECHHPDVQCELLRVIAGAIPHIPYPLRFLVTSRPEAHITHVFDQDRDLQAVKAFRYNISDDPNADKDIRTFLEKEFEIIRQVHRFGELLPPTWPGPNAITSLVERSSGHFIYASTVIRYIGSQNHRPDERLEIILRLRPAQEGDWPYAQLDALYGLIFEGVQTPGHLEKICIVLGILYFQSKEVGLFQLRRDYTIEGLLEMEAEDLVLLLDPILSLVAVNLSVVAVYEKVKVKDVKEVRVRILHKCLFDYLLDSTRSRHLPFDLSRVHESAATYILKRWILNDVHVMYDFQNFAYHCQYAYLNDTLKGYLHSLDLKVPYFESAMNASNMLPAWTDDLNQYLQSIIWRFFRTLSRNDCDSTGKVYERHVVKWVRYLQSYAELHRSVYDGHKRPQTKATKVKRDVELNGIVYKGHQRPQTKRTIQKVKQLQRELDALLTQWNPQTVNPMDVEMVPITNRRAAFIKQEHIFFSAYAKAIFSGMTAITSSLVFGDHFIHSYDLGIWDAESLLILRTYPRTTARYLRTVERYLISDLYQKYGIEPDEGI